MRCWKCGGTYYQDYDEEPHCLSCGREPLPAVVGVGRSAESLFMVEVRDDQIKELTRQMQQEAVLRYR